MRLIPRGTWLLTGLVWVFGGVATASDESSGAAAPGLHCKDVLERGGGVGDGVYWIVTTINPKDNGFGLTIRETTWADNTSASKVRIYDGGRKAQLLGPLPAKPYSDWYNTPPDQPGQ